MQGSTREPAEPPPPPPQPPNPEGLQRKKNLCFPPDLQVSRILIRTPEYTVFHILIICTTLWGKVLVFDISYKTSPSR